MPNETLVSHGPFRFLINPNYAVVILEIFVLPLAFGLVAFAAIAGLANLCILAWRMSVENTALAKVKK